MKLIWISVIKKARILRATVWKKSNATCFLIRKWIPCWTIVRHMMIKLERLIKCRKLIVNKEVFVTVIWNPLLNFMRKYCGVVQRNLSVKVHLSLMMVYLIHIVRMVCFTLILKNNRTCLSKFEPWITDHCVCQGSSFHNMLT